MQPARLDTSRIRDTMLLLLLSQRGDFSTPLMQLPDMQAQMHHGASLEISGVTWNALRRAGRGVTCVGHHQSAAGVAEHRRGPVERPAGGQGDVRREEGFAPPAQRGADRDPSVVWSQAPGKGLRRPKEPTCFQVGVAVQEVVQSDFGTLSASYCRVQCKEHFLYLSVVKWRFRIT
ncbi:hypothetical protein EYF80_029735 [Liparis tanakae]|uniref:Uncharacterized protein n=1 Tax=Liparis tanakae TaxID=230148 RepID=A0A4Z2H2P7_9TELE|nr:hypothetical protein EYF80_029735 [Liparis tanakae]